MALRRLLVAALALSLSSVALAQEAAKPAEPPKPTITPYGFVLLNTFFNANTFTSADYPASAALVQNGGSFLMSARQSRIGVKLAMNDENWTGANLTGVIEFDFKGGHFATNSTGWNAAIMRLRLAQATATWKTGYGTWSVLAGQDYGLVNPLFATSVAWVADPIFWQAGNLWRRSPQIRLTYGGNAGPVGVTVQAAILSPADTTGNVTLGAGNVSRNPDLEARLALSGGAGPVKGTLGIGYHTNEKLYDRGLATEQNLTTSLVGVDLSLALPYVDVKGEWYDGKGTDDMYFGIAPGVVGAAGARTLPKSSGYWGQAVIKPSAMLWITAGMGHAEHKVADAAANARYENDQIAGGLILNAGKYWQVGLEVCQATTKYNDAAGTKNDALQTALSSKLTF